MSNKIGISEDKEDNMKSHELSISLKKRIVVAVCAMFAIALVAGFTPEMLKAEATSAGNDAYGLKYMKTSCTKCHSVPSPSAIKPFNEEAGRTFLASHMVPSNEEDLNNMVAYFYHSHGTTGGTKTVTPAAPPQGNYLKYLAGTGLLLLVLGAALVAFRKKKTLSRS